MLSLDLRNTLASYQKYRKQNGIDDSLINAFVMASGVAIKEDVKEGLKVSSEAKDVIETQIKMLTGGTVWELDSYCNANKVSYDILDQYYKLLLLEAPYLFDSYLLYLEKDREEKTICETVLFAEKKDITYCCGRFADT